MRVNPIAQDDRWIFNKVDPRINTSHQSLKGLS
jgi:hypothetical protein